jgi:hypothetical protein
MFGKIAVLLSLLLPLAADVQASHDVVRVAQILFPPRNFELCMDDSVSIIPKARFTNVDSVSHTSIVVRFIIRNVVTRIAVYGSSIVLRNVPAGASVDTAFSAYQTHRNILSELGTFEACAVSSDSDETGKSLGDDDPSDDTLCIRIFDIRTTLTAFRDPSNNYSKTSGAAIPDQTLWASIGAEVVDGETATWDPPPPRDDTGAGYGLLHMHSPVMRLDRFDVDGNHYAGNNVGDTVTSFPINLQGHTQMILTFDYQRAGRRHYPWLWDKDTMYGPEQTITDVNGNVVRVGDSLVLEFKDPADTDCNPTLWNEIAAIDGGQDFEFRSFQIDFHTLSKNYFISNFRFRFRLKGHDDGSKTQVDDDDAWFIDNPTLSRPALPEIEITWVRIVNPYSKIPASQAALPVYVALKNYGADGIPDLPIKVEITDASGHTVYSQRLTISHMYSLKDTFLRMPDWDARNAPYAGEYIAQASLDDPGYDNYEDDNATYSKFYLNVENTPDAVQEFAYDHAGLTPSPGAGNDIPSYLHYPGAGIGFSNSTGSFAMKFKLERKDTIYGVRVYFANVDVFDLIRISLLNGDPASCTPGDTVSQQGVQSTFLDFIQGGYFNQFWPYYFPKPIVLPGAAEGGSNKGVYWIAVSQLGLTSMGLGGDFSRGGGIIEVSDSTAPKIVPINSDPYGTQWGPGNADNSGDVSCAWAMEQPAGSGKWVQWMPTTGFWPTMTQAGNSLSVPTPINLSSATSAGSYMPMIRPIFPSYTPSLGKIESVKPPDGFGFDRSAPNPFVPSLGPTAVSYHLSESGSVSLAVYNQLGQRVRMLTHGNTLAGSHSVLWDGRDGSGSSMAGGTYLCRLTSGNASSAIKIVLLR